MSPTSSISVLLVNTIPNLWESSGLRIAPFQELFQLPMETRRELDTFFGHNLGGWGTHHESEDHHRSEADKGGNWVEPVYQCAIVVASLLLFSLDVYCHVGHFECFYARREGYPNSKGVVLQALALIILFGAEDRQELRSNGCVDGPSKAIFSLESAWFSPRVLRVIYDDTA